MRREDAAHLMNHHYRLYSSIRPVVDTSPPLSMFNSPKSSFYRPFALRRPQSVENFPKRRKGREELAHFLANRRDPAIRGFNVFATSKSTNDLTEIGKPDVPSKLLSSRNYQRPLRREPSSDSSSPLPLPPNIHTPQKKQKPPLPTYPQINRTNVRRPQNSLAYIQFKDRVLSSILIRGIFTHRVIHDCFRREMEKHPELDYERMHSIMVETFEELGNVESKLLKEPQRRHVTIAEPRHRSASLSSCSSSSFQSSNTAESADAPSRSGIRQTAERHSFRIDVSPPRTVSSLSSDIDELARRLSNDVEQIEESSPRLLADRKLSDVIARAREK